MRAVKKWVLALSGSWYNDYVYFRYGIHQFTPGKRIACRLLLLPAGLGIGLVTWLRRRFTLRQVEIAVTTRCTLRCRDCANLIPFYSEPEDMGVETILGDIDDLLAVVDRIHRFIVMGGETFLYKDLYRVVDYLIRSRQVGMVHLLTNGTVIPADDLLQLLKHPKAMVTVGSHPAKVARNRGRVLALLEKYHIHHINEQNLWTDLGGLEPEADTCEQALKERFRSCCRTICHNIMDGEYYICPRSAHGWHLGQFPKNDGDSVCFRGRKDRQQVRRELKQLFKKEYITACCKCRGDEGETIMPGIQIKAGV